MSYHSGEELQADLLDISRASARLAIHPGARLALGDKCRIHWMPPSGEALIAEGIATRVEEHGMITTVVVSLMQGNSDPCG